MGTDGTTMMNLLNALLYSKCRSSMVFKYTYVLPVPVSISIVRFSAPPSSSNESLSGKSFPY